MSNISSATSMLDEDDPPRRFPWRPLLIVILLLAAGIYAGKKAPPVIRAFHDDERISVLSLAGMAAEESEAALAENPQPDLPSLTKLFASLWEDDTPWKIAYIRQWDPRGTLVYEATRAEPAQAHAAADASLADLGAAAAMRAVQGHLEDEAWMNTTAQLQLLINDQGEVTQALSDAAQQQGTAQAPTEARDAIYSKQTLLLNIADSLVNAHPSLADAVDGMNRVLDALSHADPASLRDAGDTSLDIESALTLALEEHRGIIAEQPLALPAPLAAAAPPALRWPARWWDATHGRRVLIPLFVIAEDGSKLQPAGFSEVVFYDQTGELAANLARNCWPALAAVLAVILLLIPWRRRNAPAAREEVAEEPEEAERKW